MLLMHRFVTLNTLIPGHYILGHVGPFIVLIYGFALEH